MGKTEILELETRRKIYNFILKYPGLHLRELSRKMNAPKSTMEYHLNRLKKQGSIIINPDGKYRRYFVAQKIDEREKQIINVLRQKIPRSIILFLIAYPYSSRGLISKKLKRNPSTISFHLKKLCDMGILESFYLKEVNHSAIVELLQGEKGKLYIIYSQGSIINALVTYEKCLLDDAIGPALDQAEKLLSRYGIDEFNDAIWEIFPHPYHA